MKIKFKSMFLLGLVLIICSSCNKSVEEPKNESLVNSEPITKTINEYNEMLDISYVPQRSQEEALQIAKTLFKNKLLRSVSLDDIKVDAIVNSDKKEITTYGNTTVKNTIADTTLYLMNFGSSDGYAIISGDRRVPALVAYSNEGEFTRDNLENNHSAIFILLSRLDGYQKKEIAKFNFRLDSISKLVNEDAPETYYGRRHYPRHYTYSYKYTDWKSINSIGPLVDVKWGQRYPYNNKAPEINNLKALAGCVCTATAQLMYFHKWPTSIDGIDIKWDILKNKHDKDYVDQISTLFRKTGDKLKNQWGVEGTGAYTKDIPEVLKSFGYNNPSSLKAYNYDDVLGSLLLNRPVIFSGFTERKTWTTGWWFWEKNHEAFNNGHAWLVDGFITQECKEQRYRDRDGVFISERTINRTLFHCNWGWNSIYNGYFISGLFDADNGIRNLSDPGIVYNPSGEKDLYFQYKLEDIPYITK